MKPNINAEDMLEDATDLNEMVMEAAARISGDELTPEEDFLAVAKSTSIENGKNITEQLVEAGSDEADRELRIAASNSADNQRL
jgi:hypothetical protein